MPETRRRRADVGVPRQLARRASELAAQSGDVLTDFVHAAVVNAARAAEAGAGELLPKRLPRTGGDPLLADQSHSFRYTASIEQGARCARALEAVGSSVRIVVVTALQAYVDAGGSWLDAVLPGDPHGRRVKSRRAA